jgi:hypothetical protein
MSPQEMPLMFHLERKDAEEERRYEMGHVF